MNIYRLAEKTRSFRRFQENRLISSELLRDMINSAALAPCASNLQRLRFSIITDEKERSILFSGLGWAGYLTDWVGPEPGERPSAYIVIHAPSEEKIFTGIDIGIAASYIVLSASSNDIGSCMLLNYDKALVDSVAPAAGYLPRLVIALGYPAETVLLEKGDIDLKYWRDEEGVHHVPKLSLETLVLKGL